MWRFCDLEIKKCIYAVLAILVAMAGLVGLASLGLDIPALRQGVGFIFLTFLPGILTLRILRIHNINTAESVVYSVGISVAFVMFTGVLVNFLLPVFGISKPISILPLIFAFSVILMTLSAVAYLLNKDFSPPKSSKR